MSSVRSTNQGDAHHSNKFRFQCDNESTIVLLLYITQHRFAIRSDHIHFHILDISIIKLVNSVLAGIIQTDWSSLAGAAINSEYHGFVGTDWRVACDTISIQLNLAHVNSTSNSHSHWTLGDVDAVILNLEEQRTLNFRGEGEVSHTRAEDLVFNDQRLALLVINRFAISITYDHQDVLSGVIRVVVLRISHHTEGDWSHSSVLTIHSELVRFVDSRRVLSVNQQLDSLNIQTGSHSSVESRSGYGLSSEGNIDNERSGYVRFESVLSDSILALDKLQSLTSNLQRLVIRSNDDTVNVSLSCLGGINKDLSNKSYSDVLEPITRYHNLSGITRRHNSNIESTLGQLAPSI